MAEFSQFWDTTGVGDGLVGGYTENDWIEFWQTIFIPEIMATAGVMPRSGNKLAVTGTANNNIQVATGRAVIYGFLYKNTTALAVPALTIPVLGTTGFRIVLRANHAAQTVRVAVLMSADGVAAIPAVTQNAGVQWEVSLATGTITIGNAVTLTDTRAYTKFNTMIDGTHLQTDIADNSTLEIVANVLRVKDSGITAAKIAAAVAGNGLAGGAGSALSVNVDNVTIEINADTLRVKDDGIDDLKVGNRVPQMYRRQGGDANDWTIAGTTTYTPGMVRMQAGSVVMSAFGNATVTFPVAFAQKPIVFATANDSGGPRFPGVSSITTTTCLIDLHNDAGGIETGTNVYWLAIGTQ